MSIPKPPPPAQLLLSLFGSRWETFWPVLLSLLEKRLGPADMIGPAMPFVETTYYHREFGTPLTRRLMSFKKLVDQDRLKDIKLWTHELEQAHVEDGKRLFNLDPGLLTLERLVLATGKNFSHRIYLGKGIYADLTLLFQGGGWKTLPWTFPDYGGSAMQTLLSEMRRRYKKKLEAVDRPADTPPNGELFDIDSTIIPGQM